MADRNHKIVVYLSLGGMTALMLTLLAFVWKASAQNARFETSIEKQEVANKILGEHTTAIALHNTTIAVINTKLDSIIAGQKEMKDNFTSLRNELRTFDNP